MEFEHSWTNYKSSPCTADQPPQVGVKEHYKPFLLAESCFDEESETEEESDEEDDSENEDEDEDEDEDSDPAKVAENFEHSTLST